MIDKLAKDSDGMSGAMIGAVSVIIVAVVLLLVVAVVIIVIVFRKRRRKRRWFDNTNLVLHFVVVGVSSEILTYMYNRSGLTCDVTMITMKS